ncbi:V-type H+-transporting ATPase subunit F [Nematocida ausubeli]|uniref:ATP synthase (F/14-kDa) subunit n=1 Tax=Nematocida ausubeli (strain ATCC PRA-371 / ERTm2) TaxID=1913371 RepID=H8Z9G5_NEMA1|nr:ATP synthase (F/14-kDa) subunit [Nematocida ausubeli]EHY66596.1 ATP synthase subunit [Nematocida ausubeli]KAI5133770.1 V-type H+-transporting ATPase subunit F [Nematocida ausubeli]KAI5137124.1 V-type H+-transporting ATPase subunit F [Nematocida ausubeli]KAI5149695.1 V-type H+-transporting ATPase subunit F [Nematocida ausubeli]KAI5159438.1 V-type H+-transporting ATPase subunit F [Nematocida ausubeli]
MTHNTGLSSRTKIAFLADEATISGFSLTGINGSEWACQSVHGVFNYFHVVSENTEPAEVISKYSIFIERKEIAIIFLGRKAADVLKEEISKRKEMFPLIMEIPSKNTAPSITEIKLMKRLKELSVANTK